MQTIIIYDEQFQRQAVTYFDKELIDGCSVDWRWFKAQAIAESGLNPKAVSSCGAQGLMQLMPDTLAEIAKELHLPNSPFDPLLNIKAGVYYDLKIWRVWRKEQRIERLRFMFAAYNAGVENILDAQKLATQTDQWGSVAVQLPKITGIDNARQTTSYVKRIEEFYGQLIRS